MESIRDKLALECMDSTKTATQADETISNSDNRRVKFHYVALIGVATILLSTFLLLYIVHIKRDAQQELQDLKTLVDDLRIQNTHLNHFNQQYSREHQNFYEKITNNTNLIEKLNDYIESLRRCISCT